MSAGQFKNQCLKVLDRVAQTRTPVTITKRGKPVATIVPYTSARSKLVRLAASILEEHGDPFSTNESWDADPIRVPGCGPGRIHRLPAPAPTKA